MDHFLYRDGALFAEDVPVAEIAAAVGTPFYLYSTETLVRHFRLFDEALLLALREGRTELTMADLRRARMEIEIGLPQPLDQPGHGHREHAAQVSLPAKRGQRLIHRDGEP